MKVFMLGWEFPPFISGGLGTACYGLTKAMNTLGLNVIFCLPKMVEDQYAAHVNLLTPDSLASAAACQIAEQTHITWHAINSALQPYSTPDVYRRRIEETLRQKQYIHGNTGFTASKLTNQADYGDDMYAEVHRYAAVAAQLSETQQFDIIHAHDWMTYPAGIAVAGCSGKPLILHVHSTEFDRNGEHVDQMIYDIERAGLHAADKIIAVSNLTRNIVINRYGIGGEKVEVVYNGIDPNHTPVSTACSINKDEKLVLFLGRITRQKGPEYFLQAAKKVLEVMGNVRFVMAGSGNLLHESIAMAAELGIGSKVSFTGFLRGDNVQRMYQMADLFVMPSVSEPFGLVPLEALSHDVPVIISKQSGVSEVLTHALKADFWDVEEIANKIVAVLKHPPLETALRNHGSVEVRNLRWEDSAARCAKIYEETLAVV